MPQSPFNNSNLFSNHYLEKLLQATHEWKDETGLAKAFAEIKEAYNKKAKVLEKYNEAQLEENFIKPVLKILWHSSFGVQGKVLKKDKTPDYAFFPDQESLDEADASLGVEDYYKRAVAVGDAKAWKVSLDKSRKGMVTFEMHNPSYQIDVYLRETPPKWGILTNGKLWRLYHESTSYKMDEFYEVDLPDLLQAGDLERFKYFYLFFRREAFPQVVDGDCFLDRIREGSSIYAQEIGEDLKENVYKAMKILAEGFLTDSSNHLVRSNESIREVQDNALRLLYRLLFLFYAESRDLLDANNKYYYELSLQRLKSEIAVRLDRGDHLLSVRYSYWDALQGLFSLINDGSESRGISKDEFYIPAYNGGLFDPEKNPFLEDKKIGDTYLARALDLLARSQDPKKGFVDYSSLDIRHLGSIYEGLLEYRLKVAAKEMVVVKEKGKEVWLVSEEAGNRKVLDTIPIGGLYLATDKGERKATGSYYTPDYIVKYIVKNTVEPLVERKREEWLGSNRPFAEYVLSIKVLDPAMGSGHFLVEATDQLARWLVQAWATARPEDVESKEVAEQDIHWARREVVRNCIYGVDLNPMAVELAKLSLWLKTVASNKPLSFLDHHLRCGNSLIGAELDKLVVLPNAKAEEQPPLWKFVLKQHTDVLLKKYSLIASLPDDSLQMVKWKEERFREIQGSELSRRLRELANVWLSTYFRNKVDDDDYYEMQNHLSPEKFPEWEGFRGKEWFIRAQELAAEKRFLHWEMEFPEAFNGLGNPGFDVVVGNPPYDELSEEAWGRTIDEIYYLENTSYMTPALGYRNNLYRLFITKSLKLLVDDGWHSFIVPMSLLADRFTLNLRKYLLENIKMMLIERFPQKDDPHNRVFLDAKLPTCLYISQKELPSSTKVFIRTHPGREIKNDSPSYSAFQSDFSKFDRENLSIPGLAQPSWNIIIKLATDSMFSPLGNFVKTFRGELMINYQFDPYLVKRDEGEEIIRGSHIAKYELVEPKQGEPLYFNRGKYLSEHPNSEAARHHLKSRVVYQRYAAINNFRRLIAAMLPQNLFCSHTVGYLADVHKDYNKEFFLCLFNSKLLDWRFNLTSTNNNINGYEVEALPIRRIFFTTLASERSNLVEELKALYQSGQFDEILCRVESCLPKDAECQFITEQEKSDVVHDLLAFLAEQMLYMNKRKQHEIKGFLDWLEGYIGAKVEDLTPKTKVQEYYNSSYDSFQEVMKKNRKKLKIDPTRREPAEALKVEFEASVGKVNPLRDRIAQTDRLIDQIIYKLYGLTEEEIKIVEYGGLNESQ